MSGRSYTREAVEASLRTPAPRRGPIFIVGTMGSGTTLLRLMLDSHERIAIPHETGFMRAYNAMRFVPFKFTGGGWSKRLGWSGKEMDGRLREFFDETFMRYASEHGKERWGEKTPFHTWHIDAMKRVFPDSVFVAIARHPGGTVASVMRRFDEPLKGAVNHYQRYSQEIARQASRLPKRMIVLRYEDLLLRTEAVMRELLHWLGEEWSDQVLEHHIVQGARDHTRIEGQTRADDSRDPSRIARWTSELDESDQSYVAQRLERLGSFYGYSMDDPEALAPLSETGSLLFGGREVARRIDRFADLDLLTRMPVPINDLRYDPKKFAMVAKPGALPPWPEELERPEDTPLRRAARPILAKLPAPASEAIRKATPRRTP
jgi:hypothetical protein